MSKPNKAAEPQTKNEQPKSDQSKRVEALIAIADVVLAYQDNAKPSLGELARITNRASGLLRIKGDERMAIENAATLEIARARSLLLS
ncbi:hypothetical protein [Bradyrhizobium sp. CCBAU 25338]|uniref:hypothetical protein n=1 Tax=Bradyrhizobium sp. CCBAU 25338 TaxID=1641877 RepID=UPI002303FD05|nr:hypothetical protein [Bradyrhizobium sp. CCBAU 25338]MDA9533159.1 hypothetical protein [Bradyrhizobium sp. CCBAU 25338]